MTRLFSYPEFVSIGTFNSASQSTLGVNNVINLTQQVLTGTAISFISPNTIHLEPGSYIVNYFYRIDSLEVSSKTSCIGLKLNNVNINSSITRPIQIDPSGQVVPRSIGFYEFIININSTLQLIAITNIGLNFPAINATLTVIKYK